MPFRLRQLCFLKLNCKRTEHYWALQVFYEMENMNVFICLLRGINVSGKNIIKMNALRSSFEKLGAQNIQTYIQSGNVVFQHPETETADLEKRITDQVLSDFGLVVPVMVLNKEQLQKIVSKNMFATEAIKEISSLYVTFLSGKPLADGLKSVASFKAEHEQISFSDEAVYLYCPKGYGKTKLNNNLLENKLKVQATTRNWKTTLKLLEMASQYYS